MKNILLLILLGSLVSCSKKITNDALQESFVQTEVKWKKLIKEQTQSFPQNTQLSIGIIQNDTVYHIGCMMNNGELQFLNNEDKVFEIGSISKVFTAHLLTHCHTEGIVDLNDKLYTYLDGSSVVDTNITLSQLANHTSGLPRLPSNINLFSVDINNPYKDYGAEDLKAYFADSIELQHMPGKKYNYSNLGAGTLGFVLSNVMESSYETLIQQTITKPLQMKSTTSIKANIKDHLVPGLNAKGDEVQNWEMNALLGAGGLYSNVADLSKFAKEQWSRTQNMTSLTQKPSFTVNENMKIGLGWHILKKRHNWLWHNGGTIGYTSSITIEKETHNAVIILSNVSAFHKDRGNIDELGFELMELLKL